MSTEQYLFLAYKRLLIILYPFILNPLNALYSSIIKCRIDWGRDSRRTINTAANMLQLLILHSGCYIP